jgi:hypothetical protein
MTKGRGLDPSPQCLRAKRDIPAGTLMTLFGGVTLQAWTQEEMYESFTTIHTFQHDTIGEEKFQYSVMVGSEQDKGSLVWMVPVNDFKLLHRLLGKKARASKSDRELKTLTVESQGSRGLGQYAQHTCCSTHSNSHLFPIFVSREEDVEDTMRQRRGGTGCSCRVWPYGQTDSFSGGKRSALYTWVQVDLVTFGKFLIVRPAGLRGGVTKKLILRNRDG